MGDKAKKAFARFDPEGSGFDERIGAQLTEMFPLRTKKPDQYSGDMVNSPDSFTAWVYHPELNDYRLHGGSLDPRTGMVLKGRNHPTWDLMMQAEKRLGNKVIKKDGRYFSVPNKGD
jgi:hypothetical protein